MVEFWHPAGIYNSEKIHTSHLRNAPLTYVLIYNRIVFINDYFLRSGMYTLELSPIFLLS